jgi:hypothetical protein
MGRSSSNRFYGCSVNFATPLEKAHAVASLPSPNTNNIQDPENSIWNTEVPLLSYSCMLQVEICSQQLEICKSVCMFIIHAIIVATD